MFGWSRSRYRIHGSAVLPAEEYSRRYSGRCMSSLSVGRRPLLWEEFTDKLYLLRDISEQGIHAHAADIKGKVILLDVNAVFAGANQYKGWAAFENMAPLLKDAGALGVLMGFSRPEEVHQHVGGELGGSNGAIAARGHRLGR